MAGTRRNSRYNLPLAASCCSSAAEVKMAAFVLVTACLPLLSRTRVSLTPRVVGFRVVAFVASDDDLDDVASGILALLCELFLPVVDRRIKGLVVFAGAADDNLSACDLLAVVGLSCGSYIPAHRRILAVRTGCGHNGPP